MRSLRLALLFLLAAPSAAQAGVSIRARDVPLREAQRAPSQFTMVGLHWQGQGSVSFRTRGAHGRWSAWRPAAPEAEDGPGAGERRRPGWRIGNPYWTGPSRYLEVRARGLVRRVRANYIESLPELIPVRRTSIAGSPLILSRLAWGADERIRRGRPRYADSIKLAVVHHTAGSNTYSRAQSAAIVRGIQRYHVRSNGWDDIGYNFLVDKYGQVFEGRYGGVDRNVVGAHAQGFNTGTVGVALLGNYDAGAMTQAARTALARLLAWRLDVAHVDPLSSVTIPSGGNPRFRAGVPVTLRAVSGHRDTGFTSCPGARVYSELGALAGIVAGTGLPKLYGPTVTGGPGSLVRFTARLTQPLPWNVIVSDPGGAVVATGEGEGDIVDWTWDARAIPAGRYTYAIEAGEAGASVTPATGIITGGARPVALTVLARPALITPNGDGRSEATTIQYRLAAPALVTATVVDSLGAPLGTLFTEQKPAGGFQFRWNAAGFPDGRYGVLLTARNDIGVETTATAAVIVNRTLAGFRIVPQVFSPNRDGRWDTTRFRFLLNGPARVSVTVRRRGKTIGEVFSGRRETGYQAIEWNGAFGRTIGQGDYTALVRATSSVSTVAQSYEFAVDTRAPRLRFVARSPLRLSVDEPADVTVVLDGNRTLRSRRLQPGRFTLNAGEYTSLRAVARDFAGNETAPLQR